MGEVHPGEEAVRERAGSQRRGIGSGQVGDAIPPVARAFIGAARFAALAVVDTHGEISADVLAGEPGFLRAPDERTVEILLAPPLSAPLFALGVERTVGIVVLEPWTRRRMRVNGTATRSGGPWSCGRNRSTRTVPSTSRLEPSMPKYRPRRRAPGSRPPQKPPQR